MEQLTDFSDLCIYLFYTVALCWGLSTRFFLRRQLPYLVFQAHWFAIAWEIACNLCFSWIAWLVLTVCVLLKAICNGTILLSFHSSLQMLNILQMWWRYILIFIFANMFVGRLLCCTTCHEIMILIAYYLQNGGKMHSLHIHINYNIVHNNAYLVSKLQNFNSLHIHCRKIIGCVLNW